MTQVLTEQPAVALPPAFYAFAEQHAPGEYARWVATSRALHEAAGDLQEAQHRLKAAELGAEDDEVRAIVGVRRAERRHAEAQQAAQAAALRLQEVIIPTRDRLLYAQCRAWNARARAAQEAYVEGLKRLNEEADARGAELMQQRQEEIVPLLELGAIEPRVVQMTKLYAID